MADKDMAGWKRGGQDIKYGLSKLNQMIPWKKHPFYQLSFTFSFDLMDTDENYFAYSFPYTFTRLTRFIKDLKENEYIKNCTPICKSLCGIDIPLLVVTSRVNEDNYN